MEVQMENSGSDCVYNREYSSDNGCWTNERHLNFLSLMEATFVSTMLERSSNHTSSVINDHHHHHHQRDHHQQQQQRNNQQCPRLDRFVPDISESTLDLKSRKPISSAGASDPATRTTNRQRERTTTHPYKISHDQIVPQVYARRVTITRQKK